MTKKPASEFKYVKTKEELEAELTEQFDALQTHGASYDAGKRWQAKTLATVVNVLMADGSQNPLLHQLGLRKKLAYLDTCNPMFFAANKICSAPLTAILMGEGSDDPDVAPHCSYAGHRLPWIRTVPFSAWWGGEVLETSRGKRITRRQLINHVRSRDGGAHVDGVIDDPDYQDVKTDIDPRVRISSPAGPRPLQGVHLATVRQIAWELEQSLAPVIAAGLKAIP